MKTRMMVDYHSLYASANAQHIRLHSGKLAQGLRQAAKFIDPNTEISVYGDWSYYPDGDNAGNELTMPPWKAFEGEHFKMTSGSHTEISGKMSKDIFEMSNAGVTQLILVSDNPSLIDLCELLHRNGIIVRVWGTSRAPHQARTLPNFVDLQEQEQFGLKVKRGILIIDWENLYIGVSKLGYEMPPNALVEIINNYANKQAHITERWAFADFGALAKVHGQEAYSIQPILELNGITTRYVVSTPGKNSSDMRIASELNTITEKHRPDVVILVSSDQDFRPVIEGLQRKHCKVVVLGIRGSISSMISKMSSIQLDLLEDQLPNELKRKSSQAIKQGQGLSPQVQLVVALNEHMRQHGWNWITSANATTILLKYGGIGTTPSQIQETIDGSCRDGIFTPTRETINGATIDAYRLNLKHDVVVVALTIIDVMRRRMTYTHTVKKYPTVREGYILRGLNEDERLKEQGIVLSDVTGRNWLKLATACNILEVSVEADELRPNTTVNMYRLKGETSTTMLGGTSDPESMCRRLVTAVDLMMTTSPNEWIALKTLDRHLSPYGRTAYFQAVEYLFSIDAAKKGSYENRNGTHPVTGIALCAESPIISRIRKERRSMLERILHLHNSDSPITASALLNESDDIKSIGHSNCCLWLDILHSEGVLSQEGGAEMTYRLDSSHQLVRTEATKIQTARAIQLPIAETQYLHPAA